MQSNYEKCCKEWSEKIAAMDFAALSQQIPGVREEDGCLTLRYFGEKYGVSRKDGSIRAFGDDRPLSYLTRLNIYTLLWYAKPDARLSGEWVTFDRLKDARPFAPAFRRGVTEAYARTFSGHVEELKRACRALGGQELSHSDAGLQIDAFACMPLRFLFWDADDEFPAQANILFDRSAADFIHVESTVSVASEGLARLAEAAQLPVRGSAFR